MQKKISLQEAKTCPVQFVLAIKDTLNVLTGKWKYLIIACLLFNKKRFTEIQRTIPKITARMLSRELKDLEVNGIVTRTVYDTIPVFIEYQLTRTGKTLGDVLDKMLEWGIAHRNSAFKSNNMVGL